jgi:uncharacterized protein YbjT (DUF2867 family)
MKGLILLTGATGYIGGRLRVALEDLGVPLRCMARKPAALQSRVDPTTEIVEGDILDPSTLERALEGVVAAYYLVHSMGAKEGFEERDRVGARNFATAAKRAGVQRIIYTGALANGEDLSPHLRSRHEVGAILRESGVPVIELQASIVLGAGSLSFEMIRALVERLPIMITPRWVEVQAQPIAIADLLAYLMESLALPVQASRVFQVGGADQVSYGGLMREYARQRGLRRMMIRVPVLTPRLSSLWLGLVTPLYARVGRKLIESIKHPSVVCNQDALGVFGVRPQGLRESMSAALLAEKRELVESRWCDAVSSGGELVNSAGTTSHNRLVDSREVSVHATPVDAFEPIRRIGGDRGWYAHDWLWKVRGFLDLLVGGVGVRRGRPLPDELHVGAPLDFWRVEAYEPDRFLRLSAEMKLPGRAWLEFEVRPHPDGATIRQTAFFDPVGIVGLGYWYLVYPLHRMVFSAMLSNIAAAAEGVADQRNVSAGARAEK